MDTEASSWKVSAGPGREAVAVPSGAGGGHAAGRQEPGPRQGLCAWAEEGAGRASGAPGPLPWRLPPADLSQHPSRSSPAWGQLMGGGGHREVGGQGHAAPDLGLGLSAVLPLL